MSTVIEVILERMASAPVCARRHMPRKVGEAVGAGFAVWGAGGRPAAHEVRPRTARRPHQIRRCCAAPCLSRVDEVQNAGHGFQQPLLWALIIRVLLPTDHKISPLQLRWHTCHFSGCTPRATPIDRVTRSYKAVLQFTHFSCVASQ